MNEKIPGFKELKNLYKWLPSIGGIDFGDGLALIREAQLREIEESLYITLFGPNYEKLYA